MTAVVGSRARRAGIRILSISDLESLPGPEWLIEGLLPRRGLSVLWGPPNVGKSFLALDWALSIASGVAWLGRPTKPGACVYVCAEGASGLKNRIRAWCREHGVSEERLALVRIIPSAVNLPDETELAELIEVLRTELPGSPIELVVVDTLARNFGGGDENSTGAMNQFVAATDRLREAFDCAVLVVHHSGRDPGHERGSTALSGAADAMFALAVKGRRGLRSLTSTKQKDAETGPPVSLVLIPEDTGNGSTSCVLRAGVESGAASDELQPMLDTLKQLGPKGATHGNWLKRWTEQTGRSPATFNRYLGRLVEAQMVERSSQESRGARYHIAGGGGKNGILRDR